MIEVDWWIVLATACALGLIVGSFLNVVIHRLPLMMEQAWRQESESFSEQPVIDQSSPPISLAFPPSRCPHCGHQIRAHENIPVFSFVFLRGKCAGCGARISPRYPAIEILSALMVLAVVTRFGLSIESAAYIGLTWALIALAFIDVDTQLLPDSITLPLTWAGLVVNAIFGFVPLIDSLWGAVFGYLTLWSVYWLFKLVTGKEGMGYGDFKLLAALGAWMGWQMLPIIILLSSLVGAVIGISMIIIMGRDKNIPIPFGPYLAAAGWIALIWGDQITSAYLLYAKI